MAGKIKIRFPHNFLWGTSSSAYQTEGGNVHSDWWAWEHSSARKNAVINRRPNPEQYICGQACDFYNRYEQDFSLAKSLNHNAIRIGLEWSRIQPKEGVFDNEALDHYEKMLQSAKANGLEVFLTLHHFTLPIWYAKKGGFEIRKNMEVYLHYVDVISKRLGKYVDFWLTFNEPEVYATYSYLLGVFPPQGKSLFTTIKIVNNIIWAHNKASEILRLNTRKPVSMAFHLADLQPAGILGGLARFLSHYVSNEYILRRTIETCDYIGVNYYNHYHVSVLGKRKRSRSSHDLTDLGWSIHPEGIERVLLHLKKYKKPIYVTENGLADAKDEKREKFIKDHLYYVNRAIKKDVDVRGYLHWSLTDNFEWQHGYWPRFGLIEIIREDDLRRKVRYSATKFAEICKNNSFDYDI